MEKKLIKIDRNGSKHYEGYVQCDRCGGLGLFATGTCNGQLVITPVDNGICHKCFGAGKVWGKWIERTPEYEAVLAERRAKREEEKRIKRIEEIKAHIDEVYTKHGFSADGKLYAVVEPNSYEIRDELKEAGAKWNDRMRSWVFTEKPEKWQTIEILFDELYTINYEYGTVWYKDGVNGVELVKSKTVKPGKDSQFVGKAGDKVSIKATYLFSAFFEVKSFGGYGTELMYVHNFVDADGNKFVWKTGTGISEVEKGAEVQITGAVKEHKEYKGEKQTILTRCRIKAA